MFFSWCGISYGFVMFHAWQVVKVFGPSVCWDLQHSSSTTEVPSFGHGSLAERIWEPHVWRMEEVAEHPTPMLLCKVLSVCFWLIHRCIFDGFCHKSRHRGVFGSISHGLMAVWELLRWRFTWKRGLPVATDCRGVMVKLRVIGWGMNEDGLMDWYDLWVFWHRSRRRWRRRSDVVTWQRNAVNASHGGWSGN